MGFTDTGVNNIRDLHRTDVVQGQLGTSGTVFSTTQTDLQGPVVGSIKTLTKTYANKTNQFSYRLLSTEAYGNDYKEFTYSNTGKAINYVREVFPTVSHTSTDEISIISTTFYRQVQ
jgi:hypothetical protein